MTVPPRLTLFPKPDRHPYYIVAPPYSRFSAGAKALHLLAHALNLAGQRAYLRIEPEYPPGVAVLSPDLITPRITQDLAEAHHAQGVQPILVYPEVIEGNPYQADVVIRYVLNFPGLLGGSESYAESEIVYSYSKRLAEAAGGPDRVLYIPTSDPRVFFPSSGEPRTGVCFYRLKYSMLGSGRLLHRPPGVEITREQTPEQLAQLFRRSELFYCYENTALATEALMCGCPVVFLPNEHLTDIIAKAELGLNGVAWGDSPDELDHARDTVGLAFNDYLDAVDRFWPALDSFIERTQAAVAAGPRRGEALHVGSRPSRLAAFAAVHLHRLKREGAPAAISGLFQWSVSRVRRGATRRGRRPQADD